jgi:glycosyltransferase involved in cell wall biosynthesis
MKPPQASRRARVLFITDIVTPYATTVFTALSRLVDLRVLYCSQTGTRAMEWQLAQPLPFEHAFLGGPVLRRRGPYGSDYYLTPRVLTELARTRPAAIVSAGFTFPTAYAALYALARRTPLVIHSDGTSHSEHAIMRSQRAARRVLLRVAAACVANSSPAADRFRELGVADDRLFIAPHSADLGPLRRIAERRSYDRAELRLLTAGRLIPRKGIDRLLRALARARAEHPHIRLTVVGSGPEEARLRLLARELGLDAAVEFRGFVDQPQLPACYEQADAFAFPTLRDPFGIVLLEAAASGLPLLASRLGGATGDLVRHGESGLVADPYDIGAMAAALVALATDPGLRQRLGRAAHAATLSRTPEATARGYLAALDRVLAPTTSLDNASPTCASPTSSVVTQGSRTRS